MVRAINLTTASAFCRCLVNYSCGVFYQRVHMEYRVDWKVKGKGPVLDIALLSDEHMLRSALQSRKW